MARSLGSRPGDCCSELYLWLGVWGSRLGVWGLILRVKLIVAKPYLNSKPSGWIRV